MKLLDSTAKTNWKFIAIVVVSGLVAVGGILLLRGLSPSPIAPTLSVVQKNFQLGDQLPCDFDGDADCDKDDHKVFLQYIHGCEDRGPVSYDSQADADRDGCVSPSDERMLFPEFARDPYTKVYSDKMSSIEFRYPIEWNVERLPFGIIQVKNPADTITISVHRNSLSEELCIDENSLCEDFASLYFSWIIDWKPNQEGYAYAQAFRRNFDEKIDLVVELTVVAPKRFDQHTQAFFRQILSTFRFIGQKMKQADDQNSCEKQGGKWQKAGAIQESMCIFTYADGGKKCTSSDECEGGCIVTQDSQTTGFCKQNTNPFGCFSTIESVKKGNGILCRD